MSKEEKKMNGEIIKKEINRAGITQKELAEAIFVTPQAVSKWINNQSQPTFDNIKAMSDVLKVDLARKLIASERRNKKIMKQHATLQDLNTFEKAEDEAKLILEEARIEDHYPYSTYILLQWLITATIGLTYHNSLKPRKEEQEEYNYDDIYSFLNNYFEECFRYRGQYKNQLDYDFFLMGGDLFESCEPYKLQNHDYCRDSMDVWYRFSKTLSTEKENELKIALAEIISNNSCY